MSLKKLLQCRFELMDTEFNEKCALNVSKGGYRV